MSNSNIHISQAADVQHDTAAPLTQAVFEKARSEWSQKHLKKPMKWSFWNLIFRKAGIPDDEGRAAYDKAYPPIQSTPKIAIRDKGPVVSDNACPSVQSKPKFTLHDVHPVGTPLTEDYAEVLRARQLFCNGNHGEFPRTTRGEWDSMVKQHKISVSAGDEVWQGRHYWLPLTPEENFKRNQYALMHELGHAIIMDNLKIPIKGIGTDQRLAEEDDTLMVTVDRHALLEMAYKQSLNPPAIVLTRLDDEEPVTFAWASMVMSPAGVLWVQRFMEVGLLPQWLQERVGWNADEDGRGDRGSFERWVKYLVTYSSAPDKDSFTERTWEVCKTTANCILDRYDVLKAWQLVGEIVRQYDVRLGRPTRSTEIHLSKEEVEDLVKAAMLSEAQEDGHISHNRKEVPVYSPLTIGGRACNLPSAEL